MRGVAAFLTRARKREAPVRAFRDSLPFTGFSRARATSALFNARLFSLFRALRRCRRRCVRAFMGWEKSLLRSRDGGRERERRM